MVPRLGRQTGDNDRDESKWKQSAKTVRPPQGQGSLPLPVKFPQLQYTSTSIQTVFCPSISFLLFKYSLPPCLNSILLSKTSRLPLWSLTQSILVTEEMAARPKVHLHPFYFFARRRDKCQSEEKKAAAVVRFHLVYHIHLTLSCVCRPPQRAPVDYSITILMQGVKG